LQSIQGEKEKHGKPGYKAGPRREWNQMAQNDLLNPDEDGDSDVLLSNEYGAGDALLDDLMGNTIAAADTPEPQYLGHKHRQYFNAVADHMDDYRQSQEQIAAVSTKDPDSKSHNASKAAAVALNPPNVGLPPDAMIARALRAYRDKNGTRHRPVGLIAALSHVIHDMGVPVVAMGEYTYTALLTCCRTPVEARRILQMMREQGQAVGGYSWSILIDIYAKAGDYQACVDVQQEMLQAGIPPTLASYTSLLAACYKVCIDGRVAHGIRAQAAQAGWRKWQEMRIVGVEPDVMAYGAILRLKAAVGQPEVCVNLLEEMPRFGVAPTTLCFTSALRAVARSHATAIRYEKGSSRRHRRREALTLHHGKLARHILILAENAGVEHDHGFVAALCLCAAAAGDVATAKAIYVASQIRQLDTFRTIGSNQHLARLRGESVPIDNETILHLPSSSERQSSPKLEHGGVSEYTDGTFQEKGMMETEITTSHDFAVGEPTDKRYLSYGEREYGKDSRVLSAILHACAHAVDKNGIGTMWQGRENKGYFCINPSTRTIPYRDNKSPTISLGPESKERATAKANAKLESLKVWKLRTMPL
jgi:pentatricopeptide repeat protein